MSNKELDDKYQDGLRKWAKLEYPEDKDPPCPRCGSYMESWDMWLVTGGTCTNPSCGWSYSEGFAV
jgi:hypothetical protein